MCGIFAWSGKDPKKFNKAKFDILGIFNIERGKDSCGISYDGDVYPGISDNKLYSTFAQNVDIKPKHFPVVIGHTRQSSPGNAITAENAHPFGFGLIDNDLQSFEFIGCHNGTVYNKKELASLYNIEESEKKVNYCTNDPEKVISTSYRYKIDSEILLECLYKSKDFKVLSKYNGGAALVFSNLNEPNIIYVFKGASKNYDYGTAPIVVERPLFYYKETKNSLYISSIDKALAVIGGVKDKTLFEFKENTVYKIIDGDIDNAEQFVVSRSKCTQKDDTNHLGFVKSNVKPTATKTKTFVPNSQDFEEGYSNRYGSEYDVLNYMNHQHCGYSRVRENALALAYRNPNIPDIKKLEECNIYKEELPRNRNDYGSRVYCNKFRYYRTGHLITGIFVFIQNYGFHKITEGDIDDARKEIKRLEGLVFINGSFIYDSGDVDISNPDFIPFIPFKVGVSDTYNNLHFFIQGVKVLTALDYHTLMGRYENSHVKNDINIDHVVLSQVSSFPVININVKSKPYDSQGILINGILAKQVKQCFLGYERIYTIVNGNLTHYKDNIGAQKVLFGTEEFSKLKELDELVVYINKSKSQQVTIPFKETENEVEIIKSENETIGDFIKNSLNKKDEEKSEMIEAFDELFGEQLTEISVDISSLIDQLRDYEKDIDIAVIEEKTKKLEAIQDFIESLNPEQC